MLPHLAEGGAERVASSLLQHLPSEEFDMILVVYEPKFTYHCPVRHISLNLPKQPTLFGKVKRVVLAFFAFHRVVKEEEPDVVLSFMEGPNFVNLVTCREKAVLSIHRNTTRLPKSFAERFDNLIVRYAYPYARILIAVSKGVAAALQSNPRISSKQITVIPNPVDIENIRTCMKANMPDDLADFIGNNPLLINIGSLRNEKGHWYLLRVMASLKEEYPNLRLVVLGDGPLRDPLAAMITALDLQKQVKLAGFLENPYAVLGKANALISTSLTEGLPTVLIEALACGVPVISTDCPYGPREILAPETSISITGSLEDIEWTPCGVLLPLPDGQWLDHDVRLSASEKAIAQALREFFADSERQEIMRVNCRERSMSFHPEEILTRYTELFRSVGGGNNA